MTLQRKLSKDQSIKRFREHFASGRFYLDLDKLDKELDTILASVETRTIKKLAILRNPNELINITLQNQAYRSRVVEIKKRGQKISDDLSRYLDRLTGHLRLKYPKSLAKDYRTLEERRQAVSGTVAAEYEYLEKLNSFLGLADLVIDDLDHAHWSIKAIIDILSLEHGKAIKVEKKDRRYA